MLSNISCTSQSFLPLMYINFSFSIGICLIISSISFSTKMELKYILNTSEVPESKIHHSAFVIYDRLMMIKSMNLKFGMVLQICTQNFHIGRMLSYV